MQKTKIIIATVALAAIALTIGGLASSQILTNQTYTNPDTTPNHAAPTPGFWGWLGNCFGFNGYQPYYGNPYLVPTHTDKHHHTLPIPRRQLLRRLWIRYGPCWARW